MFGLAIFEWMALLCGPFECQGPIFAHAEPSATAAMGLLNP